MNIPKALILLPAEGHNHAPSAYGVVEVYGPHIFYGLREHLRHATALTKACAGEPFEDSEGRWSAVVLYRELTAPTGWCNFIPTHPEDFEGDEEGRPCFRGVEDFNALLSMTASCLMVNDDVDVLLDDCDGDARPAIINFQEWYSNCRAGGWFNGSIEQFRDALQGLYLRTELDEVVISLPVRLTVARRGPLVEYDDFSKDIEFYFSSAEKYGAGFLETKRISMPDFISAFEDATRSLR